MPVWFMRQAGRSLPEYRAARAGISMLDSCMRPELVAEITAQPVRRYGVDAAIFYSDIMVPLKAIGVDLDIVPGRGPVIAAPIRELADLAVLRRLEPTDVDYVDAAVRLLVAELGATPLIGFAGAPFTLASYLVEGGPSKDYARTKSMMIGHPRAVGPAVLPAGRHRSRLPAGPGPGRGRRGPAVRLLGRQPQCRRLPALRPALLGAGAGRARPDRGAADPLRGRHLRAAAGDGSGRGRGGRGRLAVASGRGEPAHRTRRTPSRATWTPRCCRPPGRCWPSAYARSSGRARARPGHIFNLGHGVTPEADPAVLGRIVDLVHAEGPELRAAARQTAADAR